VKIEVETGSRSEVGWLVGWLDKTLPQTKKGEWGKVITKAT